MYIIFFHSRCGCGLHRINVFIDTYEIYIVDNVNIQYKTLAKRNLIIKFSRLYNELLNF